MQQWQRDKLELGDRAYTERRAENRGNWRARLWVIVSRYPFAWFDVVLDSGGTLRVRSYNGWPGNWKDSVIGKCRAVRVADYDGIIQ